MLGPTLVVGLITSVLPVWKDAKTGKGLNIWQYFHSTAFTKRKHITPEAAIENYNRQMGNLPRGMNRR